MLYRLRQITEHRMLGTGHPKMRFASSGGAIL